MGRSSCISIGDPVATPVLLGQERAHAGVGRVGERGHASLGPRERGVVAVRVAQLGNLQEAVGARQVVFAYGSEGPASCSLRPLRLLRSVYR